METKDVDCEEQAPETECSECLRRKAVGDLLPCYQEPEKELKLTRDARKRLVREARLILGTMRQLRKAKGAKPIHCFPPSSSWKKKRKRDSEEQEIKYEMDEMRPEGGESWMGSCEGRSTSSRSIKITQVIEVRPSLAAEQISIVPVVEEPEIKGFPLTRESMKKHSEKARAEKHQKERETEDMRQKKISQLSRLKETLKFQAEKFHCDWNEKKTNYELKKKEYLEDLAIRNYLDLKLLEDCGDELYKEHIQERKDQEETERCRTENQMKFLQKLLREEQWTIPRMGPCRSRTPPTPTQESVLPIIVEESQTDVSAESTVTAKSIESARTSPRMKKHPKRLAKGKYKSKKIHVVSSKVVSPSKMSTQSETSMESEKSSSSIRSLEKDVKIKLTKSSSSSFRQRITALKLSYEEKSRSSLFTIPTGPGKKIKSLPPWVAPEVTSIIQSNILPALETWTQLQIRLEKSCEPSPHPDLPDDTEITIDPVQIHFKDVVVHQKYFRNVTLFNPCKRTVDCGFSKTVMNPDVTSVFLDVEPKILVHVKGGCAGEFKVSLEACDWSDLRSTVELRAAVWFHCRHRSGRMVQFRRLLLRVVVTVPRSLPTVLNRIITFPPLDFWSAKGCKRSLQICNGGSLPCVAYVRRVKEEPADVEELALEEEATEKSGEEDWCATPTDHPSISFPPTIRPRVTETMEEALIQSSLLFEALLPPIKPLLSEGEVVACAIVDLMVDEALSPFRYLYSRGVNIPAHSKVWLPIRFVPALVNAPGPVREKLTVTYQGVLLPHHTQEVTLVGELQECPLRIEPDVLDMMVLTVGCGVRQNHFTLTNTGNGYLTVRVSTPAPLSRHITCRPSIIDLRPGTQTAVSVTASIGWKFIEDAGSYLDAETCLLDCPIHVISENLPPAQIRLLAAMAQPLGLSVSPSKLDLGIITTAETAIASFWLINNSIIAQHFAFINLPKWVQIMPRYGISLIGPCEELKLQLLYSPGAVEAGGVQRQAEHTFTLQCTTRHRLLGLDSPPASLRQSVVPLEEVSVFDSSYFPREGSRRSTSHSLGQGIDIVNPIFPPFEDETPTSKGDPPKDVNLELSKSDKFEDESDEEVLHLGTYEPLTELTSQVTTELTCKAVVIDPICELSAQHIIFPNTPIMSFAMTSIYLKCPKELMEDVGYLGLKKDRPKLVARYQLSTDCPHLFVEPSSGELVYGQNAKITIMLKPDVDKKKLLQVATLLSRFHPKKAKSFRRSTALDSRESSWKSRKSSRMSNKASRLTVDMAEGGTGDTKSDDTRRAMRERDLFRAKLYLVREMETTFHRGRIKCLVETKQVDNPATDRVGVLLCDVSYQISRPDIFVNFPGLTIHLSVVCSRVEVLQCDVSYQISRPDIFLNFPGLSIDFGVVAIMTKSRKHLEVHNTSGGTTFFSKTHLRTDDVFTCSLNYPLSASTILNKD